VHQELLKACFGVCAEADLHLLQHKDLFAGDLESSLQLVAEQDEKNAKYRATRFVRVELRGVERGGEDGTACDTSQPPEPVQIICF